MSFFRKIQEKKKSNQSYESAKKKMHRVGLVYSFSEIIQLHFYEKLFPAFTVNIP